MKNSPVFPESPKTVRRNTVIWINLNVEAVGVIRPQNFDWLRYIRLLATFRRLAHQAKDDSQKSSREATNVHALLTTGLHLPPTRSS